MVKRGCITRCIPVCAIGAITIAFVFSQSVTAHESGKDVSQEISALRNNVSMAEIYHTAPDVSYRSEFEEIDVIRRGCHYKLENPVDIDSLMDVVANAKVVQIPPNKDGYIARIVIRFHQSDRRTTSLVLGPDYDNAPAQGIYYKTANVKGAPIFVEAKNSIERSIRFWTSQHESLAVKPCHH